MAIGGVALFRADAVRQRTDDHLIRPPGVIESDLLDKCLRCGECMRSCPTHGLQPAFNQAGLEGLWTPLLIPRLGYCDYSCNACGQLCPVEAIPPLELEQKRQQVIGHRARARKASPSCWPCAPTSTNVCNHSA